MQFLHFLLYLLLTILGLGVLILVHELGHYLTARACHVTIYEFSLGMGKRLCGFTSKKTGIMYSLRLFPIGGYVSMAGEDGGEEDTDAKQKGAPTEQSSTDQTSPEIVPSTGKETDGEKSPRGNGADDPNAFCKKNVWQRILILFAGAGMNILTGFLAMLVLTVGMFASGYRMPSTTIGAFYEGAPSQVTGLAVGDTVLKVDGVRVHTGYDLSYEIMNAGYQPIDILVERDGQRVLIEDVLFPQLATEGTTMGDMDFKVLALENSFGNVMKVTFWRSVSSIKMVFDSIGGLITGRYSLSSLSGPIGVSSAVSEVASQPMAGWNMLYLFALIAMNLGVMNLLPIPALDGGRLFFRFIEVLRFGKPINPRVEARIHGAGMMILLLLTAVIAFKDIFSLF